MLNLVGCDREELLEQAKVRIVARIPFPSQRPVFLFVLIALGFIFEQIGSDFVDPVKVLISFLFFSHTCSLPLSQVFMEFL